MVTVKKTRLYLMLALALILPMIACSVFTQEGPPSNALVIDVVTNTALTPWLEEAVGAFNDDKFKTEAGERIYIQLVSLDAGQAVTSIVAGQENPALWIPDEAVWVDVMTQEGNQAFQGDCVSVAESPLVIAMWRPLAESLGWPGRKLGWLDIGSIAADPSAWAYYSGGQYGPSLRLGHTHPGLSNTGMETLLAVVQSAQSAVEAVSVEDIQEPIVQASVGAFEGAVSWFSKNTDTLGATMRDRGAQYLGAAIVYESTVLYYGEGDPDIVPIYPFEGTFMATHPACVNSGLNDQEVEAARILREFLLDEESQEMAVEVGLRTVSGQLIAAGVLGENGRIDTSQPEVLFEAPDVDVVYAIQELWQSARRDVSLVMLLDVSGSMEGDKILNVQSAAQQFVKQMGDDDYITLIAFADNPDILIYHEKVEDVRDLAITNIADLIAWGDTTLYDAIADGASVIASTTSSQRSNVLVVLTDGMDTASTRYLFDQELVDLAAGNNTTIFTIAYGSDADEDLLESLATQANGNFYLGDEASIAEIYDEMSAGFGGTVGVGR
jgi:Ca-activated chloride channel family protein